MRHDEATLRQIRATQPKQSTWLSANAGSGKTRVLTNRVALLLLEGTKPQNILCLTYTKAAAAEMQNRLFERLGEWAMLSDAKLLTELSQLNEAPTVGAYDLDVARTLFAQAIEAPGGLRVQTIHSFCASVLRRFPLEAQVSPLFKEMDERASKLLAADVVSTMAASEDALYLKEATTLFRGESFDALTSKIINNRAAFDTKWSDADILEKLGAPADFLEIDVLANLFDPATRARFPEFIAMLQNSTGKGDQSIASLLGHILTTDPSKETFWQLHDMLVVKKSWTPKLDKVPVSSIQKAGHPAIQAFHDFMLRCWQAGSDLNLQTLARKTLTLHRFANAFFARYEAAKSARALLDFDDLIHKTKELLTNKAVCDWVMYRLDGGIDHILVDESQDTSEKQWQIIQSLTQEFGHEGDDGRDRTIFVVGDKKQSIYSFQGADPRLFDEMATHFDERLRNLGGTLHQLSLSHSFRSSPAILQLVDAMFATKSAAGFDDAGHEAFYDRLPGRVDLWDQIKIPKSNDYPDWWDTCEFLKGDDERVVMARKIAAEIDDMVRTQQIPGKDGVPRPIRYGDFLILVRKRSDLFAPIIRACKERGLPMAGADQLVLFNEIGVQDLRSLLRFLALPQDSLSLAEVLRSPLCGLDEAQLFRLAHNRTSDDLWSELVRKRSDFPEAHAFLKDLRDNSEFLAPFELIDRALTYWGGKRKLLERLGAEAEEGINAFLALVRSYEATGPVSLTGFLAWIEGDETKIKRQVETGADKIRIMTIHGAKGLEAPIVILPETGAEGARGDTHVAVSEDQFAYAVIASELKNEFQERQKAHAKEIAQQERLRLLYVAMTRAERWLIVCGVGKDKSAENEWHQLVSEAMQTVGAAEHDGFLRHETGDWPMPKPNAPEPPDTDASPLPDWTLRLPAPEAAKIELVRPTDGNGPKSLAGEPQLDDPARAADFGTLVHLLLEQLPANDLAPAKLLSQLAERVGIAPGSPAAHLALQQAQSVLAMPGASEIFGPNALVEVSLSAPMPGPAGKRIFGQADRVVITDKRVLVVDFKSNAVIPATAADVPSGILEQMAVYVAALGQIYPDRSIEAAIVWTAGPRYMSLPHKMVSIEALGLTSA